VGEPPSVETGDAVADDGLLVGDTFVTVVGAGVTAPVPVVGVMDAGADIGVGKEVGVLSQPIKSVSTSSTGKRRKSAVQVVYVRGLRKPINSSML